MYKTNIVAFLSSKDIKNFTKFFRKKRITKRELFLEALAHFQNQISGNKHYKLKHQDIDRIQDSAYGIVVFEDTFTEVKELNKKFKIGRNRLLREIICEYLRNNKT